MFEDGLVCDLTGAGIMEERAGRVGRVLAAALQAVDPYQAVVDHMKVSGTDLQIEGCEKIDLQECRRVLVVAVGKASLPMMKAAFDILGSNLTAGVVVPKTVDEKWRAGLPPNVEVCQGSHPVPGPDSEHAAERVAALLRDCREDDVVLFLISGGGSALLSWPVEGVQMEDIQAVTRALLASGAEIGEMNTIRKHLDRVKGGGLARMAFPASVTALILSDVVGSPLDVIASGPTVPDSTTFEDAWAVVGRYQLQEELPGGVSSMLQRGVAGEVSDTPKEGDACFQRVSNVLVGSNTHAAAAALQAAMREGFNGQLLSTYLQGEARQAGRFFAGVLRQIDHSGQPLGRPACVVAGGEMTVTIVGEGRGGRNLETALGAVEDLDGVPDVLLVSLATDGEDALTGMAGAFVSGDTLARAKAKGLSPQAFLFQNDSLAFFEQVGGLLETGSTGTNVNDLYLLFAF